MPSSSNEGSQSATVNTEHTLATITTAGVYQLSVDVNALANGDTLELRAKLKVRSTGTTRQCYYDVKVNAQTDLVVLSPPIAAISEVVFTLKQTAGTGRTFPWEVIRLDA